MKVMLKQKKKEKMGNKQTRLVGVFVIGEMLNIAVGSILILLNFDDVKLCHGLRLLNRVKCFCKVSRRAVGSRINRCPCRYCGGAEVQRVIDDKIRP